MLEEAGIMKGKDISHTQQIFQNEGSQDKNRKNVGYFGMDPNIKAGMVPMPMGYQMYPGRMYPPSPYMHPSFYPNPYYDQAYFKPPEEE